MFRRGCLFGVGGTLVLLLLCCALGWFVAIPRVRDSIRDDLADNLATNVATQIRAQLPSGVEVPTGRFNISVAEIEDQVHRNFSQASVDAVNISAANGELLLSVESGGQTLEYRGVPVAENGRLVMTRMEGTSDWMNFILPPGKLGEAIEQGVNEYFGQQDVRIDTIQLSGNELIVQTSPEP